VRWEKAGLVFSAGGQGGWINTHAQVPTALVLDDRLRIYFAARPRADLSLPGYVDLARDDPSRVLGVCERPILECGRPGTFDADGVMPSSIVRHGSALYLYYSGWSRLGGRAPYNNATGLAISRDGGATFERAFEGPILDRAPREPWSATSPTVLRDGGTWHMWYSSGTDWVEIEGKLEHVYVLKYAHSEDGIEWTRTNRAVIPQRLPMESQTKPAVIRIAGQYHMWFCYRGAHAFRTTGETYRIGYAWSYDLMTWSRDDAAAGIDVSASGWDAQMICYPEVVRVDDRVLLFYNGNGFGATGFGYATLA
jgi:predicted GH43/DUF377 family glycosyl hydrolase